MKNQFSLNIKTPCSENFDQFTPTTKGGFCDSCQKEVIDFTKMNAQEIGNYFKYKSNANTCGRFNSEQLSINIPQQIQRNRFGLFGGIGLAVLSFFSMFNAQAQDNKKQTIIDNKASTLNALTIQNTIVVKGNVSESNIPLPGVNVVLQGTVIGVTTDFDGNFKFPTKLENGDVLVFSYVGMKSQKVIIRDSKSASKVELQVDLKADSCILMGKVAVKKVYKSKRK